MKDTIKRLVETYGPAGFEDRVRDTIKAEVEPFVDEVRVDVLGNLICVKRPKSVGGRRIMMAAHMDEIGVVITYIDDKGFLRFSNVGGLNPHVLLGERVVFADGTIGVFGHERVEDMKDLKLSKMFIDIGARSKEEAEAKVKVGDFASYSREFRDLGSRLVSKAMDDRIGCAVLVEAIKRVGEPVNELYFVFTVQEELGLRGARTSAYGINPEIGISIDVTGWGDTPEAAPLSVSLGKGVAIKAKDAGLVAHPRIKNLMIQVAEAKGIPYQMEVLEWGATDAGAMHVSRSGVPSGTLSIPARYVHTPSEMVDLGDVQAAVDLLVALVRESFEGI